MTRIRWIRGLLAAVVLTTSMATLTLTSQPASATAQAPAEVAAPTRVAHRDACGPRWFAAVPDSGYYRGTWFNFHSPCHLHDWCYANKPWGSGPAGRRECDDRFVARTRTWCNNRYAAGTARRSECRQLARIYYEAVRTFGAPSFYLS
jgi:hypothetical protein